MDRNEIREIYRDNLPKTSKKTRKSGKSGGVFLTQFIICFILIFSAFAIKNIETGELAVFKSTVKNEISKSGFEDLSEKIDEVFKSFGQKVEEEPANQTTPDTSPEPQSSAEDNSALQPCYEPVFFKGDYEEEEITDVPGSYMATNYFEAYSAEFLRDAPPEDNDFEKPPLAEQNPLPEIPEIRKEAGIPDDATFQKINLGIKIIMPVAGKITSPFGYRTHPVTGEKTTFHYGIDIAAKEGTAINSAFPGTVTEVGSGHLYYGNYVRVKYNDNLSAFYGHCKVVTAKVGDTVSIGQKIAEVGNTGITTGSHLHLEFKYKGVRLNPKNFFNVD